MASSSGTGRFSQDGRPRGSEICDQLANKLSPQADDISQPPW